jgi:hypothetical protein
VIHGFRLIGLGLSSFISVINGDVEVQHFFTIAELGIKFDRWIITDIRLNKNNISATGCCYLLQLLN